MIKNKFIWVSNFEMYHINRYGRIIIRDHKLNGAQTEETGGCIAWQVGKKSNTCPISLTFIAGCLLMFCLGLSHLL